MDITYVEYIRILIDRSRCQSLNNLESGILDSYYELKKLKTIETCEKFDMLLKESE